MNHILRLFLPLCATFAVATPAVAAPFTYAPDTCEFQITFPEKPFIEKKCTGEGKDCTEIVSYTKAIGATSSTSFRVSCNPIPPNDVKKYTPEILEETLKQMAKSNNLEPYNTQSATQDGYTQASSLCLSTRDQKPLIYNSQIWVGTTSMFTIEAEMLGQKNNTIEKTFAEILKNTHPKNRASPSSSELSGQSKAPETIKTPSK